MKKNFKLIFGLTLVALMTSSCDLSEYFYTGLSIILSKISSSSIQSTSTSSSTSSSSISSAVTSSFSPLSSSTQQTSTSSHSTTSSTSTFSSSQTSTTSNPPSGDFNGYYNNANGSGDTLLKTLYTITNTGSVDLGYDGLKSAYKTTDDKGNGYFFDVYSDEDTFKTTQSLGTSANQIGMGWNREHTIPKSWWGGSPSEKAQASNLYIVRLSDTYCNSTRNNNAYGEVTSSTNKKIGSNKVGTASNTSEVNGTVFEPIDSTKGDLARGYFYAAARYNNIYINWTDDSGSKVFGTGSSCTLGFKTNYLQMLLRWHKEDPVDDFEIARNAKVQKLQGDRNPFVDHPSWVDIIWGGTYQGKNSEDTNNGTATVVGGELQ